MEKDFYMLEELKRQDPEKYFQEVLEVNEFEELKKIEQGGGYSISWEELIKEGVVKINGKKVEGIYWKGNLDLKRTKLKSLWKLKVVQGYLDCYSGENLQDLGELEEIWGYLNLRGTKVKSLGKLEKVGGYLLCGGLEELEDMGELKYVGGDLSIDSTKIKNLGKIRNIGGGLDCRGLKNLETIGNIHNINGFMNIEYLSFECQKQILKKIIKGKLVVWGNLTHYKGILQMYKDGRFNYKYFNKKYGEDINEIEDADIRKGLRLILFMEYSMMKDKIIEKGNRIREENEGKELTEEEKINLREEIAKIGKDLKKIREKIEGFGVRLENL